MDSANTITVVVPVLNRHLELAEMLASVKAQTVRGFELIVVDNGSEDSSAEVALKWAQENRDIPVKVLSEPSIGEARARNAGLAEVRTPWTLFFDSDDLMHPDHIRRAAQAINDHPDADLIGWDTIMLNGADKGRLHRFSTHDKTPWWDLLFVCTMATQRYVARTDLFRSVGGWNPEIGLWDDMELGARILTRKPSIIYLEGKPTVFLRRTAQSVTGNDYQSMVERMNPALDLIDRTLPAEHKFLSLIKRAILHGYADREAGRWNDPRFKTLKKGVKQKKRLILNIAYLSYRLGLRGGARIVKPIYRILI